ncbi:protein of unknown function [Georgfuchsia toluolica]|uniref:Uncharacterized protein n=1 Tax=Georgfuchsia toluolica TaxID=424218 RepID=A0A916NJ30_9PROT|nr:protein of unknown function [Georgfuchsia toluolica]
MTIFWILRHYDAAICLAPAKNYRTDQNLSRRRAGAMESLLFLAFILGTLSSSGFPRHECLH